MVPGAEPVAGDGAVKATGPNEERERSLRERLMRSRQQENGAGSSTSNGRRSASPDRRGATQRRPSPSYDAYGGHGHRREPGAPPRREDYYARGGPPQPNGWHQRPQTEDGWGPPANSGYGGRYYDAPRYYDRGNNRPLPEEENGAPPPGAWGRRPPDNRSSHGSFGPPQGGSDFMLSRNEQRNNSTLSIWPPSPTEPYRSESEDDAKRRRKGDKSSRRHKHKHSSRSKHSSSSRHHHESSSRRHRSRRDAENDLSDVSDSEEEERRRRRKRREREADRHRDRDRGRDHRRTRGSESDHDDRREHRRSRHRSDRSQSASDKEDAKHAPRPEVLSAHSVTLHGLGQEAPEGEADGNGEGEIGPQLPTSEDGGVVDPRSYGKALLPGEGAAMAAFVQEGKRIPRRGEIGLSSDQIEDYEKAGFVMSGSRHRRMNAVRVRKENQVLDQEEKRALLNARREEKEKKEREVVSSFREMLGD